jgi:predicted SAM-dependent methyltransferase
MEQKDQKQAWMDYSSRISAEDIKNSYLNPTSFQQEFNVFLSKVIKDNSFSSAIEIGCEAGISLMLLNPLLTGSTFLDYDHTILEKVDTVTKTLGLKGTKTVCEDMFTMESIGNETYDVAYNSGVIEHYTKEVRTLAIKSYSRITKKGGYVVVAYPNHHTLPYRLSYLIGKKIFGDKVWPWPAEYKFYSLQDEMESAGLVYMGRSTMDRSTLFNQWLGKYSWSRSFLHVLDKFMHFEGYLTVCIAKKM